MSARTLIDTLADTELDEQCPDGLPVVIYRYMYYSWNADCFSVPLILFFKVTRRSVECLE